MNLCRNAHAMAPCKFSTSPANLLRRLCVSDRSRCGAVRICNVARKPSAEIVRVGSLSLWRRANFQRRPRTLCGEFSTSPANPLRRLCVSDPSRCGAVRIFYVAREPSAEIVRVESLSLWRRANFLRGPRTLCRECANRSRCGVARISKLADKPSAEIVRVGALSLRRRANLKARRRTLCGDCACRSALAVAPCELDCSRCGAVRICNFADEPFEEIALVGALAVVFMKFKYKSSTRSTLPQLRPENRKFEVEK